MKLRQIFLFLLLTPLFVSNMLAQKFLVEPLIDAVNSKYDEITPIVLPDGKSMFFTRVGSQDFEHALMHNGTNLFEVMPYDEYLATLHQAYLDISGSWVGDLHNSAANQDIWFAHFSEKKQVVEHLAYPLNTALPNSVLTKTPDPNVFYVVNKIGVNGNVEKGISYIEKLGSSWSFPTPVEIDEFYTITSEVSACMGFDGKYLLLSAKRDDARDLDLYICNLLGLHHWSAPSHLGSVINSEFRETAPSISDDGKTLYFTSNRGGDNDVYFSQRQDETWRNWSKPQKMDAPINSAYDDGQPCFNSATGYLYFSSRRYGTSDIYKVKLAPPQAQFVTVKGRIINERTGALLKRSTIFYTTEGDKPVSVYTEDGNYSIQIPRGKKYQIRAEKAAFSDAIADVHFKSDARIFQADYILDLSLSPFGVNEQIVLNPIYFLQSKPTILESSLAEVQRLAVILKESPSMHIRIEGHTDNMGKVADLIKLSDDRAKAIKKVLLEAGINESRLDTKGFGGTRPVNVNDTDDDRKLNRRVEIIITKI
jgi:outer membrane protein OmpA-like peptidoglycan-associated protein